MVKSLVSKLSVASSNLSLASTLSSVTGGGGGGSSAGSTTQETNYAKHRNDPGRFFGDGVQFKAKLIGILEVGEARGDRMCQEALQDLKMAIRAAGEHKQRITIHVTIDGLRLRDEKTGDSLYHHPVHKISFIAQDMTDSRAFGYIFGSPDSGHRFFGIKTDKAASQVVLAMRDLFQVVFELKKKEIELARQQIQSRTIHEQQLASLSSLKSAAGGGGGSSTSGHNDLSGAGLGGGGGSTLSMLSNMGGGQTRDGRPIGRLGVNLDSKGAAKEMSPESVADLVDLEQELSSIQRGITQMERITPSEPTQPAMSNASGASGGKIASEDDPFGDSFTNFPTYNLLPPPESGRSRHKPSKPVEANSSSGPPTQNVTISSLLSPAPASSNSPTTLQQDDDDGWLHELDQQNDVFDTSKAGIMGLGVGLSMAPLAPSESTSTPTQQLSENSTLVEVEANVNGMNATATAASSAGSVGAMSPVTTSEQAQSAATKAVKSDAFTDLDPLGTGRIRPYVDKKYFFHELKNPPKKVLKDLSSGANGGMSSSESSAHFNAAAAVVDEFLSKDGLFDDTLASGLSDSIEGAATSQQQQQYSSHKPQGALLPPLNITNTNQQTAEPTPSAPGDPVMLPRDTDPFSPTRKKSDPFQEGDDVFAKLDPFEFEFVAAKNETSVQRGSPSAAVTSEARRSADVFNGPLQVNLPPERGISPPGQWRADGSRLERQVSESSAGVSTTPASTVRSRPTPSAQLSSGSMSMGGMSGMGHGASSSVLRQQTADVISSISNKKMPHLFGQARFSKRDSNSINMRRLQESDSLSENEAAPEPPPRPDSASHVEPPPLPPKKQFNDIVIRPRVTSGNAVPPSSTASISSLSSSSARYDFLNSSVKTARASDVPPIPLPSRRVGRSDGTYPGPGRPRKPGHTEDDYLAPIGVMGSSSSGASAGADVPPLLPPPTQTSTRARAQRQQSLSKAHEIYENKSEIMQQQQQQQQVEDEGAAAAIIPDITLSQLLTLGIDELAAKLNVPTSKLSTMTLVELTSYLSEFIERSKPESRAAAATKASPMVARRAQLQSEQGSQPPLQSVFKVNFDQQATFVAKFDDTFGEDMRSGERSTGTASDQDTFVANFEQFNEPPVAPPILDKASRHAPAVPPADRYAVFREIIDQELQHQQENADLLGDVIENTEEPHVALAVEDPDEPFEDMPGVRFEAHFDDDDFLTGETGATAQNQPPKIDTKITEVVAQAKDRYAALRDIILVENLFDKKSPATSSLQMQADFTEFDEEFNEDQFPKQLMDDAVSSTVAEPSSSVLTVEDDDEDEDGGAESSLDSNDKDADAVGGNQDRYEKLSTSTQQLDGEKSDKLDADGVTVESAAESKQPSNGVNSKQDNKFLTVASSSGLSSSKDDLEIDELMQRAISNLSLDSRERISPANSTTQAAEMNATPTTSGSSVVPRPGATLTTGPSQFNDVSTSPIPLQKSPIPGIGINQQQKSPLSKSPQPSPVLTQLSAVSSLIDNATKQMSSSGEAESKNSKEFWATFDSPKPEGPEKRSARATKTIKSTSLHLPPPPPSNASQNDTAESPCSSDPRDEGWSKSGGSGGVGGGGVSGSGGRRWTKKERHQTSSSSRDLSPWDDELPDYQKQKRIPGPALPPGGHPPHGHAPDRHGYYARHSRRMNSCDEDYDYEDEFSNRRDHRKFKQGLSRSRDNFELESPSWYHHPTHHTWSPQDVEQAAALRARSFDRSAYERTTYGPPIYDKRGVALPPPGASSYDRRSGGGYDKRKYYRDYARPNYDLDEYGDPIQDRYRETGSFEKLKMGRRADYENIYDDGRSPLSTAAYKSRIDYMYDRDRKSFDRESVESFESATRRRRSFGSGDVYGSLESREDFRDRYMGGAEKTRSLRKGMKLRATGDIDYEQDSENDFHQRGRSSGGVVGDTRSLQRPSQLSAGGMSGPQPRMRKSSGSSPWDGEEPPLPGQKSWKRPSSAADSERRLAESRRAAALGQTPSGSDGEKDRRFRKKQRSRGKEIPYTSGSTATTGGRYGNAPGPAHPPRDNYDYITYDDDDIDDEGDYVDEEYDEPPTDEDKFERLNRRRHEMHQRMLETERRQQSLGKMPMSSLKSTMPSSAAAAKKYHPHAGRSGEYDFDDYEQTPTPRSNASGGSSYPTTAASAGGGADSKFSFDGGFESDFNQSSPPPAPAGTASSCNSTPAATGSIGISAGATPGATKSSFRFSNDFSDREKMQSFAQNSTSVSSLQQFDLDAMASPASHATPPITQKLRFDDNVKVSQFDDAAFEDDFSNAQFDFEKEDQWHAESLSASGNAALAAAKKHNLRNSKLQQRQELIKKSESINIFAKKVEDPFEDDEFFKSPSEGKGGNGNGNGNGNGKGNGNGNGHLPKASNGGGGNFQCEDDFNFAKFDENM